jgi:adenylate kinase
MLLRDKSMELNAAIAIEVPDEVIVDRLGGRLTCGACGMVYGADSGLKDGDPCGNCGQPLSMRADDTPDAIRHRLKVFRKNTEPLVDYYRGKGILKIVDGDRSRDAVASSIEAALSG